MSALCEVSLPGLGPAGALVFLSCDCVIGISYVLHARRPRENEIASMARVAELIDDNEYDPWGFTSRLSRDDLDLWLLLAEQRRQRGIAPVKASGFAKSLEKATEVPSRYLSARDRIFLRQLQHFLLQVSNSMSAATRQRGSCF